MEEAHLLWCRLIWLQSTSHSPTPSWHSDNGYPLFTWRHMFAFTWGWGHIIRQNKSIAFSSQSRKSANLFLQSSELGLPQLLTRMRVCPPSPRFWVEGHTLKIFLLCDYILIVVFHVVKSPALSLIYRRICKNIVKFIYLCAYVSKAQEKYDLDVF
jgi:hypothetical protein